MPLVALVHRNSRLCARVFRFPGFDLIEKPNPILAKVVGMRKVADRVPPPDRLLAYCQPFGELPDINAGFVLICHVYSCTVLLNVVPH